MPGDRDSEWTTEDWKRKLDQQARDSMRYRRRRYEAVDLGSKERVLDIGCGTGAVTLDIANQTDGEVVGIDLDRGKLDVAREILTETSGASLVEAEASHLPFGDGTFDLVVFNLVLIYVTDQQAAMDEMARVTMSGGHVLATMEPDYAGQISYPEDPFLPLMRENLEAIGADLFTGRKLKTLFTKAGLETEVGVETEDDFVFQKDDGRRLELFLEQFWVFEKVFKSKGWTQERIEKYRDGQAEMMRKGLSMNFMPSFYAIGRKV